MEKIIDCASANFKNVGDDLCQTKELLKTGTLKTEIMVPMI